MSSTDPDTMLVRPAHVGDSKAVSDVLTASYGTLYRGWYDDTTLDAALPGMGKAQPSLLMSGRYFVAVRGGTVIACGGWSPGRSDLPGPPGAVAHVRHFATHPDHVRQGAGRALFEACRLSAAHDRLIAFEVVSSLPAEPFYAALGFETVREDTLLLRGGLSFAVKRMRRDPPRL